MHLMGRYAAVLAKVASFTLDPVRTKVGTLFTNRGAVGAVVMTLPQLSSTPGGPWDGYWIVFQALADQSITIACTAGKAICFNNAAATSLAASTGGQKIGAEITAVWDAGSAKWVLSGGNVGVTYTVA